MAPGNRLTREELYELVWTNPMSRLALQYGISDVGLAKVCRRMNVPKPGRGYWARLSAHLPVKRAPLPKGRRKARADKRAATKLERAKAGELGLKK